MHQATNSLAEAASSLRASSALVKASDPKAAAVPTLGGIMSDPTQSPEAASWCAAILFKLLPGGLGAAVMIAVDPPASKRELFARMFVAFSCSLILGDVAFDALHSFSIFAFLDAAKRSHTVAVDFIVGGVGWFVIGAAAMLLKKYRADPLAIVDDVKKVTP